MLKRFPAAIAGFLGLALLTMGVSGPDRAAARRPAIREIGYGMTGIGRIAVYRPIGQPRATLLFLSGESGWTATETAVARRLSDRGMLVAGVSTPELLQSLEHGRGRCINPNYALIALARDVQHHMGVHAYMKPIVMGYDAGASIAYGGLAQWPNASYRAVVSLRFGNRVVNRKPWCRAPGFAEARIDGPAHGWRFAPNRRIKVPWIVLQDGGKKAAGAIVAAVPAARMIMVPESGQSLADPHPWLPQLETALAPMLAPVGRRADGLPRDLPITVIPGARGGSSDVMAVIYSGDGGWVGIDRDIAGQLSARGISVVGVDSLSYFWSARTPAGAARDLGRIITAYSNRWHRPKVMLIGYSFGADTLPAIVGSLDSASRARIDSLSLLGLSATADFQFHLASWLNIASSRALPTVPAIVRLKGLDIRCIRGLQETDSACDDIPDGIAHVVTVPGDHHFNRNALLLTRIIAA